MLLLLRLVSALAAIKLEQELVCTCGVISKHSLKPEAKGVV